MPAYAYSGAPQFVTVDATGEYELTAYGAQGGSAGAYAGGNGAAVQADFNLTAGEHLEIIVGGEGGTGDNPSSYAVGAGGGGGTFILANTGPGGTYQLLEVAGGGGGGGPAHSGYGGLALGSAGSGAGGSYGGIEGSGGGAGVNSYGGSSYLGATGGANGHDTAHPYAGGASGGGYGAGGFGGGGGGSPFDSGGSGGGGGYSGGDGSSLSGGANGGTSWVSTTASGALSQGSEHTGNGDVVLTPVCFCSGTLIRTSRGEVAVEDLQVGDLAVTSEGVARPIVWTGSRTISRPTREQLPVRVMAGALGEGLPKRDLWLSSGHAVCINLLEEVLVSAGALVNGGPISREEVSEVTYWHVELESHDILVAEGLGCESYMDAGNRAWFYGAEGPADPERAEASLADYARPFVGDAGSLDSIRRRLTARAERLGWTQTTDMDLQFVVDGERIDPVIAGEVACILLQPGTRTVSLVSRTFSPAWTGHSEERRELGLCLGSLRLSDGFDLDREIPLESLTGFHPEEADAGVGWRWTTGHLDLPASLWDDGRGPVVLRIGFDPTAGWTWRPPQAHATDNVVRLAKIA